MTQPTRFLTVAMAAAAASLLTLLVYRLVAERGRATLAAKVAALEATVRSRDEDLHRGQRREGEHAATIAELRERVTALDRDAARLGAELERERAGAAEKVELLARAEARLKDAFSSLRRPDLIVRLPSGRSVAVDSKVPLSHYLEALEAADEDARVAALRRHAA